MRGYRHCPFFISSSLFGMELDRIDVILVSSLEDANSGSKNDRFLGTCNLEGP